MMKVLYILQNGYHSEKYRYRNLQEWSVDLHRSHTGRRLMEMIPDGCYYFVINSTPEVGENVDSMLSPNLDYIISWINKIKPDVIVACGKVAQRACNKLLLDFISAPHPAWRQLSRNKTEEIRSLIFSRVKDG